VGTLVQNTALEPPYNISLYAGSGTADGIRGDHILIAPPYNTTKEEIELIAQTTQRVVEDVFANLAL
jgi:adenosylmethionine-8-amino-7-oxononanoate aminotransferase